MSKGKIFNLLAGVLDILFALSLITIATLSLVFNIDFINNLLSPMLLSSFVFLESIGLPVSGVSQVKILTYVFIGILEVIGLFSLIFGSVTIAKTKKEAKKYHRLGSVITFLIFEMIGLAFFTILLVYGSSIGSIIAVSVLGLILFLRFLGIIFISYDRKKYLQETPMAG